MRVWKWMFGCDDDDDIRVEWTEIDEAAVKAPPVRECRDCRWLVTLSGSDRRCGHERAKRLSPAWLAEGEMLRAVTARQSEAVCGIAGKIWEKADGRR